MSNTDDKSALPPVHRLYREALEANAEVNRLEAENDALGAELLRFQVELNLKVAHNHEARDCAYLRRSKANTALLDGLRNYRPGTDETEFAGRKRGLV